MFDDNRKRWMALYVLCSGVLMIVLDTTIVNVALPSIRVDLHFTETSLVWVVNAYMLTFGGFLLLGRAARRSLWSPALLPARAHPVHGRVAGLRARAVAARVDRGPRDPGHRRRGGHGGGAFADHGPVHRNR
jgi:MFS family permease